MKIVIFGAGGSSIEVASLIEEISETSESKYEILGFIEKNNDRKGKKVLGYFILGDYRILDELEVDGFVLPIGDPKIKQEIYNNEVLKSKKNLKAVNLIHPSVILRKDYVSIGIGNIICAGSILTTNIQIRDFNLINTNCTIAHDVKIGSFNVISPQVAISGGVEIGNNVLIGTGAKVLQNLKIGDGAIVGAGAVVTKDVEPEVTVVGIPAKVMRRK